MLSCSGFSVRLCVTCHQTPWGLGTTHAVPFEVIVFLLSLYKVITGGLYVGNTARKQRDSVKPIGHASALSWRL